MSKWTNLTSIVLENTLLIFKRETPTSFLTAVVGDVLFTLILNLIFYCVSGFHWLRISSHTLKFECNWLQTLKDSIRSSLSLLKVFFSPHISSFFMFFLALVNKASSH